MIKITFLFLFAICLVQSFADEAPKVVPIVSEESDVQPDGQYNYEFETGDGTVQEQKGTVKVVDEKPVISVEGKYSYTDDEGHVSSLTYTADETGYHPSGDLLPVAPPVPVPIARALDWAKDHPYVPKEDE